MTNAPGSPPTSKGIRRIRRLLVTSFLSGVPAHVVMRRLGHADFQTTLEVYGWVTEDAELRALSEWATFAAGWKGITS